MALENGSFVNSGKINSFFFFFRQEIITCQPAYAISNQLREKEPVGYAFLYLNVAVLFSMILEK